MKLVVETSCKTEWILENEFAGFYQIISASESKVRLPHNAIPII